MDKGEIKKLASLSRVEVSDEELKGLAKDLDSILSYVSELQSVSSGEPAKDESPENKNVMREDEIMHESVMYTKDIVEAMPDSKDGYLKVKKIL